MNRLSSFVEDALETLRKKDGVISNETTQWLLNISDMFARWNDDFINNRELSKIKFSLLKLPDLDKK
jgi:two-component system chemotaxis sensor kinase CheA